MVPVIAHHKHFILAAVVLLMLAILSTGCQSIVLPMQQESLLEWKYADLRLLDPMDAATPGNDLVAMYTRTMEDSFQIRLDFLALGEDLENDIYIPIDTNPGGTFALLTHDNSEIRSDLQWDYLLKITRTGDAGIIDSQYAPVNGPLLFVIFDSSQDRIIIDVMHNHLPIYPGITRLQAIVTTPGSSIVADRSAIFAIDSPPPPRVQVVFAFWDTFSASTPAQALRSWAGAHSGPMSSRHGLKYLLDAAERHHTTVFLLDLLTQENLSALDYMHAISQIRDLASRGIIGLPEQQGSSNTRNLNANIINNEQFNGSLINKKGIEVYGFVTMQQEETENLF